MLAWNHARLGNVELAVSHAKDAFEKAVRYGQVRLAQSSLEPWSEATRGRLPFAELTSCFEPMPDDLSTTVELKMAETWWHLANHRTDHAVLVAEEAVQVLTTNWIQNDRTVSAFPNLAQALRRHADMLVSQGSVELQPVRRRQLRAAKQATRRSALLLRCVYPYALRELAYAYDAIGRIRKAYKYACKSVEVAKQQDARSELAHSLLLCGHLGAKLGRPESTQQIAKAQESLRKIDEETERVCSTLGANVSQSVK